MKRRRQFNLCMYLTTVYLTVLAANSENTGSDQATVASEVAMTQVDYHAIITISVAIPAGIILGIMLCLITNKIFGLHPGQDVKKTQSHNPGRSRRNQNNYEY